MNIIDAAFPSIQLSLVIFRFIGTPCSEGLQPGQRIEPTTLGKRHADGVCRSEYERRACRVYVVMLREYPWLDALLIGAYHPGNCQGTSYHWSYPTLRGFDQDFGERHADSVFRSHERCACWVYTCIAQRVFTVIVPIALLCSWLQISVWHSVGKAGKDTFLSIPTYKINLTVCKLSKTRIYRW